MTVREILDHFDKLKEVREPIRKSMNPMPSAYSWHRIVVHHWELNIESLVPLEATAKTVWISLEDAIDPTGRKHDFDNVYQARGHLESGN